MSEKVERPITITAAALLFGIMGVLQLGVTWTMVISYQKIVAPLLILSGVPDFSVVVPIIIIIAMLAQSVLSIAVAYGLLKLKRWAGILGIVMIIMEVILIGIMGILLNMAGIALIALGWKNLK